MVGCSFASYCAHFAWCLGQSNPAEDITAKFAEPLNVTNQLLYDLDQHIVAIIDTQQQSSKEWSQASLAYSNSVPKVQTEIMSKNAESQETPKTTLEDNNIDTLLVNLGELDKKLQVS